MPAKRLTDVIRCKALQSRIARVHTGLRIEILGIADLHGTRCSMNSRIVVDRIFFCNLIGVYRSIRLALSLLSDTNAVNHLGYLPS